MAVVTPTGGKVLWHSLERVDIDDLDATELLPLQAVADSNAGLVGARETSQHGLLSALEYDGSVPTEVTLGAFKFVTLTQVNGAEAKEPGVAAVATYERVSANGITYNTPSLDFTGYTGTFPYVWAQRSQVEADELSRVFWDDEGEDEYTDPVNTRIIDVVTLALSPTPGTPETPPDGDGWVKIARASSVASSVVLEPRYVFDRPDGFFEVIKGTTNDYTEVAKGVKFYPEVRESRGPGMLEVVTAAFATLAKIMDGRWQVSESDFTLVEGSMADGLRAWWENLEDETFRGLLQHDQEIDTLEASVASLEASPFVLAWGMISDSDVPGSIGTTFFRREAVTGTFAKETTGPLAGLYTLTVKGRVRAVHVTPAAGLSGVARSAMISNLSYDSGDNKTSFNVSLYAADDDGVTLDACDFFITAYGEPLPGLGIPS